MDTKVEFHSFSLQIHVKLAELSGDFAILALTDQTVAARATIRAAAKVAADPPLQSLPEP